LNDYQACIINDQTRVIQSVNVVIANLLAAGSIESEFFTILSLTIISSRCSIQCIADS